MMELEFLVSYCGTPHMQNLNSSYAEFKFRNDLWPDYNKEMVLQDLLDYTQRNRRMGG
ncbi:MAG: undecaprenyl diphosphate synthase family protein [Promethearchaeota archaeon]